MGLQEKFEATPEADYIAEYLEGILTPAELERVEFRAPKPNNPGNTLARVDGEHILEIPYGSNEKAIAEAVRAKIKKLDE